MRQGLEAQQQQDRMSEDLMLMPTMGQQQQEILDSQLVAPREQKEQTQELGLPALTNSISPGELSSHKCLFETYPIYIEYFRAKCFPTNRALFHQIKHFAYY